MKIRKIQRRGYDNGVALAKAWISEDLMLCPDGEVSDGGYRLVDKKCAKDIGDGVASQGVNLNLLELWEKYAIKQGNQKICQRIRIWNEKRLLNCVEAIHKKNLTGSPDKDKYPEVQGLAAYKDEEAKGIADVFRVDYRRVLLCKGYRGLMYTRITEGWEEEPCELEKCTTVIFKESPVGPIIGRNMDSGIQTMAGLQTYGEPVLHQYPEEMGYSYLADHTATNSKGLVIQGSSIQYPNEPMPKPGFIVDENDLILRFCKTVDDTLRLIERYNPFFAPTPCNLAVLDANGNAAIVERTKNTFAVRKTDRKSIFTTDGVAIEEKTRKIQGENTQIYQFNLKRHRLIDNLLLKEEKAPSVEAMQRIMTNHSMPSPICKHLKNLPPYYQLTTLYSFILVPREQVYYFSVMRPGPVYPCEQEPTKYSYWFS